MSFSHESDISCPGMSQEEFESEIREMEKRLLHDLKQSLSFGIRGLPVPSSDRAEITEFAESIEESHPTSETIFRLHIQPSGTRVQVHRRRRDHCQERAIKVAEVHFQNMFDGEIVLTQFQGDAAKLERGETVHVVAAFASTSLYAKRDRNSGRLDRVQFLFTVFPVTDFRR